MLKRSCHPKSAFDIIISMAIGYFWFLYLHKLLHVQHLLIWGIYEGPAKESYPREHWQKTATLNISAGPLRS